MLDSNLLNKDKRLDDSLRKTTVSYKLAYSNGYCKCQILHLKE